MKQKISQHDKYIWQLFDDNQLRLLPKGNKVSYFSNNKSTRFMPAKLINSGAHTITVPETLPTDILAKRGMLSGGFAEHTKGYYHSRKNKKFTDILCVVRGVLSAKFDGKKYKLKTGDALVIPPNRLCDSYVEGARANVFWLHFKSNRYWNGVFGKEISIRHFSRFDDIHAVMRVYFSEVYGKRRSLIILESLADILAELIKGEFNALSRPTSAERYERFVEKLAEVESRPEKSWKSKDVARELSVSVKRLDEMCLAHSAQTFNKFVLKTRMKVAFNILKEGALTVAETASRVGYATPYSFSRIFKSYYGRSPRNFSA